MSREGPAPGGIYSDDGLRLEGLRSPDGSINSMFSYRNVASSLYINDTLTGAYPQLMSTKSVILRKSVSLIKLRFQNYLFAALTEIGTGNAMTVRAGIEYPAGVFTQVLFNGQSYGIIPNKSHLLSDQVNITIPKHTRFKIHIWQNNPSGILYGSKGSAALGEGGEYGITVVDRTMGGSGGNTGGGFSSGIIYSPVSVLGWSDKPAIYCGGDSKVKGQNDTVDGTGFQGELNRSIGPYYPDINVGISSDTMYSTTGVTSGVLRRELMSDYTDVVLNYGSNDFFAHNRSLANIQQDVADLVAKISPKSIWLCTVGPYSTDSNTTHPYSSTVTQTTLNATFDAIRKSYNDWLRTGGIDGVAGYIEIADVIESTRDSGLFIVNGTDNYFTSDGLHENRAANLLIAASKNVPLFAFE